MTGQISDLVAYDDVPYVLTGAHGHGLFDPRSLGITTTALRSSCWRGFHCTYAVVGGALELHALDIGLAVDERLRALRRALPGLVGLLPTKREGWSFTYENLNISVPFSGGLLLGAGFNGHLAVNMGYHPAWRFREVRELLFEEGHLSQVRDVSAAMSVMRADFARRLHMRPEDARSDDELWIVDTFRLDYDGLRPPKRPPASG